MPDDYIAHHRDLLREKFSRALLDRLAARGGIVGPLHEEESKVDDFRYGDQVIIHTLFMKVNDLPEPESYILMGGPADGRIVQTGGQRTFRVPILNDAIGNPYDVPESPRIRYAEYEREGDSQVYVFRASTPPSPPPKSAKRGRK